MKKVFLLNQEFSELPPNLIRIGEAADYLGVSIKTLRRWEAAGKFPAFKTVGGTRFYSLESLRNFYPDLAKTTKTNEAIQTTENFHNDLGAPPPSSKHYISFMISLFVIAALTVSSFILLKAPFLNQADNTNNADVLATTTSKKFIEINSDTQIIGSIAVTEDINGLGIEASPSASVVTLTSGNTTFTVTESSIIDQNLSTSSSPTFSSLTLSSTSSPINFSSAAITFPSTATTLVGIDLTQTLTNKTISGSSNTLTNIPNSALSNGKLTVSAGTNLTGGGEVALGGSITLNLKDNVSLSGNLGVSGNVGIGTSTTPSNVKLGVSGNVGIGVSSSDVTAPNNGLYVEGNVGIGATSSTNKLDVWGNVRVTGSLSIDGSCAGCMGTTFQTGDGTATNPAFSFTSDTDNGLWRIGTDQIALTTGGNAFSGLSINSVGNVGIGTTSPGYDLEINGTGYFSSFLGIGSSLSVIGNVGVGASLNVTSAAQLGSLRVSGISDLAGNVGIGGSGIFNSLIQGLSGLAVSGHSTLSTLTTSGNVNLGSSLVVSSAAVLDSLQVTKSISGTTLGISGLSNLNTILTQGNVGIAATSAGYALDVWGDARITGALTIGGACLGCTSDTVSLSDGSSSSPALNFINDTNTGFWRIGSDQVALTTGGNAFSGLSINSVGNVGIGTTSPGYDLEINGTGYFSSFLGVGSSLNVTGNVGVGTSLTVTSASILDSLSVTKSISSAALGTTGNVGIGGSLNLSSLANLASGLVVIAHSSLSTLTTTGNVNLGSSLVVTSVGSLGSLQVSGISSLAGGVNTSTLTVSGNTGIGGSLTTTGLDFASGGLRVNGFSDLTGNVGVGGTLTANSLSRFSSQIQGANGFNSAPTFSFINSTSTGLYSPSTNALSLVTNGAGTPGLTITSAGNVGIGITSPSQLLHVGSGANSLVFTSGGNLGVGATTASAPLTLFSANATGNTATFTNDSITTGTILNLSSTSNVLAGATGTGSLLNLSWAPTASITSIGDLFSLGIGVSGSIGNLFNILDSGSSIFSISETALTSSLPANFTAPGDVGIAYDINFTNPTASYIKSSAPLYIQSGEVFNSSDLTLSTYNSGQAIFDFAGGVVVSQYQPWVLPTSTMALNFQNSSGTNLLSFDTTNSRVGIGSSGPLARLQVNGGGVGTGINFLTNNSANSQFGLAVLDNGNVGIGTTAPGSPLSVIGSSSVTPLTVAGGNQSDQTLAAFQVTPGSTRFSINSTNGLTLSAGGNCNGSICTAMVLNLTGTINVTSETVPVQINAPTYTITGSYANQRITQFTQPTITAASSLGITTEANTVNISGAPISAGSATIANSIGLRISSGTSIASGVNAGYGLYVDAPTGALNNFAAVFAGGNVGIGATLPQAKLVIQGNLGIGYTGANQAIPTNGLAVFGNVGIGTTTANYNLTVPGTGYVGNLTVDSCTGCGSGSLSGGAANGVTYWTGATTVSNSVANFYWDSSNNRLGIGTSSSNTTLNVAGNMAIGYTGASAPSGPALGLAVFGNVGIGTTSPTQALDVVGSIRTSNAVQYKSNAWEIQASTQQFPDYFSTPAQALEGIFFVNSTTGWAVGNSGAILKTSDGTTWINQSSPTSATVFLDVYYIDSNTGWTTGSNAATGFGTSASMFKTTDGGTSWSRQVVPLTNTNTSTASPARLLDLFFINSNTGWAVGNSGAMFTTTDGGTNWTTVTPPNRNSFTGVHFIDANTGWAVANANTNPGVGNSGVIFKSTDGGANWTSQAVPLGITYTGSNTFSPNAVYFIDANIGWVVGGQGLILKTTNGGSTWTQLTNLPLSLQTGSFFNVYFANANIGWLSASGHMVFKTTDGGTTWRIQQLSNGSNINSISCPTTSSCWAVGSLGNILYSDQSSFSSRQIGDTADLAELYESDVGLLAGEVVSTVGERKIDRANKGSPNAMLGVISTDPAIVIEGSSVMVSGGKYKPIEGKYPVALSGRVPVKVSLENGPIGVGDYLTASSIPGVAAKAIRPGPVIGKALEGFFCSLDDQSTCPLGKVLTFVNLSYADPLDLFASLNMDNEGNLMIPKIKLGSSILGSSVAVNSDAIPQNDGLIYYDLADKIASLEERIGNLELKANKEPDVSASESASLADQLIASASAKVAQDNLDLVPPDILLATGSATLANLSVTSNAEIGERLISYEIDISKNLKVFGNTTLGNTLIAGDLTVDGTLTISQNSLNSLPTIFLQNLPLAENLDIFNGKVVIDKNGNITTLGEVAAASITTNKLTISNILIASASAQLEASSSAQLATIGTAKIPAGQTKITISSEQITEGSKIFITPSKPTPISVSKKDLINKSFTVELATPQLTDINFDWWIIESK